VASPKPSVLRVARATNDFGPLLAFYGDGLGFTELGRFEDHDGFDGVMLGHPDWPYHLEFTIEHGKVAPRSASPEHLLVFYLPDTATWQAAVDRMAAAGVLPVAAGNPYWDRCGKTFEDADGYRVVLQNSESPF
jgi:catechol 2,3-dioxygenase-like lactoylglutathione lyase family enzyme